MSFDDSSRLDTTLKGFTLTSRWFLLCLIGIGVIGHSFFMSAPFVNLEYVYHQSAELISGGLGFKASLLHLAEGFNNPLGNSIAIASIQSIFGVTEWSARIPSLLSWLICVSVVYLLGCRWLSSSSVGLLAAMVIGFSPLFWVYGGIAYPDLPFTALITVAMFVAGNATYKNNLKGHLLAALLVGLATLFRYNGILFCLLLLFMLYYTYTLAKILVMLLIGKFVLYKSGQFIELFVEQL